MSQFDWQTDDDGQWHEPPESADNVTRPNPRRLILIVIALLIVGGVVTLEMRRRVNAVTEQLKADVNASFGLLTDAVRNQDRELFVTLLSGRNPQWAEAQLQFWQRGDLFERNTFDLASAGELTVASIVLSPDLNSAELTLHTPFQTNHGVITLAQTIHFRRGDTYWLYAPPDETFWGDMAIMSNSRLTIIYPERDAEIVTRLFDSLSRIAGAPPTEHGNFQADQPLQIELTTNPQALLRRPRYGVNLIELPAPTLFGLPTDEHGFELLLGLYSHNVFVPVQAQHLPEQATQ